MNGFYHTISVSYNDPTASPGQWHFDESKKKFRYDVVILSVCGGLMDSSAVALLTDRFASLQDPRTGRAKRHEFMDVIVIAICAVICGSDSWVDVEIFGKSKKAWLSRLLKLANGIPSHDTFGRIFAMLDPVQFESCFTEWIEAVNEVMEGQVVAVDGKTIRRSHDRQAGKSAIHMVSAWASANHLVLGQLRVVQ